MIGFQTGPGTGRARGAGRARAGSTSRSGRRWPRARSPTRVQALMSGHGAGPSATRSNDPDKTYAACVWLWSRDASLCDAPGLLGKELDTDVRTGQLNLSAGTRCVYGTTPLTASSVAALAKVTRDREVALTALVVRAIEQEQARVSTADALALEQRIVRQPVNSSAPYRAALAEAGASVSVGRAILGDELRSRRRPSPVHAWRLRVGRHAVPGDPMLPVLARDLLVSDAELATRRPWCRAGHLGPAGRLPGSPTGRRTTVRTVEGVFTVEPRDDTVALAAVSHASARPAIVRGSRPNAVLMHMQRGRSGCRRRRRASSSASRTGLPELGVVDVSSYAPFLSLSEPEADRWLAAQRGTRRRRERAASRRLRPCRARSSSRARARRPRAR